MKNYTRKKTNVFGTTFYYNDNDECHRLDGPAIEYADGSKFWYIDGKRHRLDGPAIERADGDKSWWFNGQRLTKEEFKKHPLIVEYRLGKIIGEVLDE